MLNTDDRIFDEGLTANEGWLLQFIASKINEDGEMWWSNKRISEKLGWSMVRLQATKEKLVKGGYLQITPRFNDKNPSQTSNLYRVLTPLIKNYTPTSKLGTGPTSELDRGDISKLGTPPTSSSGTAPTSKLGNEVLIREALTKEALTASPVVIEDLPFKSDEFLNAWQEWKRYKKERRQNLTSSTVKLQLKKLSEMTEADAIQAIKTSIEKGWTGLFFENGASFAKRSWTNRKEAYLAELVEDFARRHDS